MFLHTQTPLGVVLTPLNFVDCVMCVSVCACVYVCMTLAFGVNWNPPNESGGNGSSLHNKNNIKLIRKQVCI